MDDEHYDCDGNVDESVALQSLIIFSAIGTTSMVVRPVFRLRRWWTCSTRRSKSRWPHTVEPNEDDQPAPSRSPFRNITNSHRLQRRLAGIALYNLRASVFILCSKGGSIYLNYRRYTADIHISVSVSCRRFRYQFLDISISYRWPVKYR